MKASREEVLTCVLLLAATAVAAAPVDFAWDASPDAGCTYTLLWGRAGSVTNRLNVGTNQTASLTNAPAGPLAACVVASLDGMESLPSNIVTWTNAPGAPTRFRLVQTLQTSDSPAGPWREISTLQTLLDEPTNGSAFYRVQMRLTPPAPPLPAAH